jgi:hypothetical protein
MVNQLEKHYHYVNGIVKMSTVKKIKKAQRGISCPDLSRRPRTPLRERVQNLKTAMRDARDSRKYEREERRAANSMPKGPIDGYTRDFPGDVSPGGFKGDPGGKKGTKWVKDADGKERMLKSKRMKQGGKVAAKKAPVKKAKSGIKQSKKKK